jgi:hypothetical protein
LNLDRLALGFKLEDARLKLKESTDKKLEVVETFSPKDDKDMSREVRVVRVLEKDKNIELTVGYF